MGLFRDKVKPGGALVIGMWPKDDCHYKASAAEVDEDNEPGSTPSRIQAWVRQLKKELHP